MVKIIVSSSRAIECINCGVYFQRQNILLLDRWASLFCTSKTQSSTIDCHIAIIYFHFFSFDHYMHGLSPNQRFDGIHEYCIFPSIEQNRYNTLVCHVERRNRWPISLYVCECVSTSHFQCSWRPSLLFCYQPFLYLSFYFRFCSFVWGKSV